MSKLEAELQDLSKKLMEYREKSEWSQEDRERFEKLCSQYDAVEASLNREQNHSGHSDGSFSDINYKRSGETFTDRAKAESEEPFVDAAAILRLQCGGKPRNEAERSVQERALSLNGNTEFDWTTYSSQLIDGLFAQSVMYSAGVGVQPVDTRVTQWVRQLTLPTPGFRAEAAAVADSDPTFDTVQATAFNAAVQTTVSRESIMDNAMVARTVMDSHAQAAALQIDASIINGAGTTEPQGIYGLSGIQSVTSIGALSDYTPFITGMEALMSNNVMPSPVVVMAPRTYADLASLQDSTNQPMMIPNVLSNYRMLTTTQIPTNLGGGSNESYALMGDFSKTFVAMRENPRMFVLNEAKYNTGQIVIVSHWRFDVVHSQPGALCVLDDITS